METIFLFVCVCESRDLGHCRTVELECRTRISQYVAVLSSSVKNIPDFSSSLSSSKMESKKDYKIKSSTRDLATLQKESQEFIRSINEFLDKSKQIQQSIQEQLVEHEAKLKANPLAPYAPRGPYTPLDQLPTTKANAAPNQADHLGSYMKRFNAEIEASQMFFKFTAKSAESITDIRADIINLTEDLKEVHEVVKSLADKSQSNKTIEQ